MSETNFSASAKKMQKSGAAAGVWLAAFVAFFVFWPQKAKSQTWQPLGSGMQAQCEDLEPDGAGGIFVGGVFTTANGVAANNIARWNGTTFTALGSGVNSGVFSIAATASNNVYAGGNFTTAGGSAANRIARWNGTSWSAMGTGANNTVFKIAANSATNVYAVGLFTTIGGVSASRVARWNGTSWSALGTGISSEGRAVAIDGSGNVYVGGNFTTAGGVTVNNIARWNGTSWSALGTGANGPVNKIMIVGTDVYIVGNFTSVGGVAANRVARWNGTSWSAVGTAIGNNDVYALAQDASGNFYAGGNFTSPGSSLVVKSPTGEWTSPGTGANSVVKDLLFDPSTSRLYAVGSFVSINGVSANFVARTAPLTNPGGVPGAGLWLKADQGVTTGATLTWADQSGAGRNATQATAANQPVLTANLINFNPSLTFDGTNDYLNFSATGLPTGTSANIDHFAVGKNLNTAGNWQHIVTYGANGGGQAFGISKNTGNANAVGNGFGADAISSALEFNNGAIALANSRYTGSNMMISSFGVPRTSVVASLNIGSTVGKIGVDAATALTTCWNGNIPEIITFPTNLAAADVQKVNSYLAIKYGITLDQSAPQNYVASNGATIWDGTANLLKNKNIAGIGRDDLSALNQKQSRSVNAANSGDLVTMGIGASIAADNASNANNFSADRSFLIWGDDQAAVAWQYSEAPANRGRLSREWRVQETGTVGTVRVRVPDDSAPSGAKLPAETSAAVYLLVDADGDFSSGATEILMTPSGTNWEASFDFSSGQYFTFATLVPPAPGCAPQNLKLWFAATGGPVWNGSNQVLSWNNQVAGSAAGTVSPTGTQPTYVPVGMNFNPTVSFSGNSPLRSTINPLSQVMSASANEAFFVVKNTSGGVGLSIGINNTPRFDVGIDPPSFRVQFPTAANGSSTFTPVSYPGLLATIVSPSGGGTAHSGRFNGAATGVTGGSSTIQANVSGSGHVTLGGNDGTPPAFGLNGEIGEVLFFDNNLTPLEREKVETYLAIKWGITLAHNYVSGSGGTIWNYAANGAYNNRITGIGREDCQGLFQKQSKSVASGALLTIGLGQIAASNQANIYSFPQNPQVLVVGDDNGSTNLQRTDNPPGTCGRMTRVWKTAEWGSEIGGMAMQFDLSALSAIYGGYAASNIFLLVSSSASFSTVLRTYTAASFSGGVASFSGVDLDEGEFFTLGVREANFSVTVASNSPVCAGAGLNLTATGGTSYAWSGPNGFFSSLQNPSIPFAQYSNAGNYVVTISNSFGCRSTATLTVAVQSCNPDECVFNVCNNATVSGSIAGQDADGDVLTYTILQNPANGTLVRVGNNFTYDPVNTFVGEDQLVVRTCDPSGACVLCVKKFVVTGCGAIPVCGSSNLLATCSGVNGSGVLNATDPSGGTLSYSIVSQPSAGTISLVGNAYSWAAAQGFEGSATWVYRVTNANGSADCPMTVAAQNCFPSCDGGGCGSTNLVTGGTFSTSGSSIFCQNGIAVAAGEYCFKATLTNNCAACPADAAVYFTVNGVRIGTVLAGNLPLGVPTTLGFSFSTAEIGATGAVDVCLSHLNFGTPGTSISASSIELRSAGATPPLASDDAAITACANGGAKTIDVLDNDIWVQPTSTVSIVTAPAAAAGTAAVSGQNVVFTPNPAFSGAATIVYRVCNGAGCCDDATVRLDVFRPSLALAADATSVCPGEPVALRAALSASDTSIYAFQWQTSPNGTAWTNVAAPSEDSLKVASLAATTFFRLTVTTLAGCTSSATQQVFAAAQPQFWAVDEDQNAAGHLRLWSFGDYANPTATATDYGRISYFDPSTSTVRDIGDAGDMEAMAVNRYTGLAYFLSNSRSNNGASGAQALWSYDLKKAAREKGSIVFTLVGHVTRRTAGISAEALAFDPLTNRLFSADPVGAGQNADAQTDVLTFLNLNNLNANPLAATAWTTVGPITGAGQTNNYVDGLEFSEAGDLFSIDGTDRDLYRIDKNTGAILAVVNSSIDVGAAGATDFETLGWDALNDRLIAVDNAGHRFVELSSGASVVRGTFLPGTAGLPTDADFEGAAMFFACDRVRLGNLVFLDTNGDGNFDAGEGAAGVDLQLFLAGQNPATDIPVAKTATAADGSYFFENLESGVSYFVHVPASEFQSGGPLFGRQSITGAGGDVAIDDNADENGLDAADPSATGVSSGPVLLTAGAEPTDAGGESGFLANSDNADDDNGNLTVDFAFCDNPLTATVAGGGSVCSGGSLTLTSAVAGGAATFFQWQQSPDGATGWANIAGATSATHATGALTATTFYRILVGTTANCLKISSNTAAVTVVSGLTASISATVTAVCAGGSAALTASTAGGAGAVNFQWQLSSDGVSFWNIGGATTSGLATGPLGATTFYKIVATQPSSSCSAEAVQQITVNPSPVASASNGGPFCPGATITVVASGGTSYAWAGPLSWSATGASPTRAVATAAMAGLYSVTVSSAAGCTATAATTVAVQPCSEICADGIDNDGDGLIDQYDPECGVEMSISSTPCRVCQGETLTLIADGGTSYLWSTGATSASIGVTSQGSYSVTITNAQGATKSASYAVRVDPVPTATATAGTGVFCEKSTIALSATGGGTYAWAGPNGFTSSLAAASFPAVSTAFSGAYRVTVTNAFGCSATATTNVTIHPAPANLAATAGIKNCTTPAPTVSASSSTAGLTWSWAGPSGFSSASQNPAVSAGGAYTVMATVAATGCTATATAFVEQNDAPFSVSAAATGAVTCRDSLVRLVLTTASTGNLTFSWAGPSGFSSTQKSPFVAAAGAYSVTATDPATGCTATAAVNVSQNKTAPTVSITGGSLVCAAPSATLTASSPTAGATFSWTGPNGFSASGASITARQAGLFQVRAVDPANGCRSAAASTTVTVN